jgi:hypothetical protein
MKLPLTWWSGARRAHRKQHARARAFPARERQRPRWHAHGVSLVCRVRLYQWLSHSYADGDVGGPEMLCAGSRAFSFSFRRGTHRRRTGARRASHGRACAPSLGTPTFSLACAWGVIGPPRSVGAPNTPLSSIHDPPSTISLAILVAWRRRAGRPRSLRGVIFLECARGTASICGRCRRDRWPRRVAGWRAGCRNVSFPGCRPGGV